MQARLCIVLVFLLQACTKGGGNIYVEGRVCNPVTGHGISDVELQLYRPEVGGTIGNSSGNKTVETVRTDAEGHYEISHLGGAYTYRLKIVPKVDEFFILGTTSNDFDVPVGNDAFIVKKGKNMVVDYEVVPMGKLKFSIKNTNCMGSMDNIKIVYKGALIEDSEVLINDTIIDLDGCVDLIDEIWVNHPMGERYYEWIVTKNNVTTIYQDTVQISAAEEKIYEVFY